MAPPEARPGVSSRAKRGKREVARAWNPRRTGIFVTKDADQIHLVLSDGLRAALDSWKARRDARWPEIPRPAKWLFVTKWMTEHLHESLMRFAPHLSKRDSDQIDRFLRRYDLEPLRAYAKARAAAAAAALPPPSDGGGLTIVSAVYGKGRKSVDVTTVLVSKIAYGRLLVWVGNSLGGDPAVGVVKKLTVKYLWKGRRRSRTVAEHETLALP